MLKEHMGGAMSERRLFVTEYDMKRLRELLAVKKRHGAEKAEHLRELEGELDKATVVKSCDIPNDVITMNSTIRLLDLDTAEKIKYTLVFPDHADSDSGRISILAPIGTALIGYRKGDIILWRVPGGEVRLKVLDILYQPEAAGHYDV